MSKTKHNNTHTTTYNVTIHHDPTTPTTQEMERMLCFSISTMNTMYCATVADACVDHKEYVTRWTELVSIDTIHSMYMHDVLVPPHGGRTVNPPRPTSRAEKETYYNARTKYEGLTVIIEELQKQNRLLARIITILEKKEWRWMRLTMTWLSWLPR